MVKRKWSDRDWIWFTGILITIIVVIFSLWINGISNIEGYFSTLASSVSIALALVAIYIAVKQDGENRKINCETKKLLVRIDGKLNVVRDKMIDPLSLSKIIEDRLSVSAMNVEKEKIEDLVPRQEREKITTIVKTNVLYSGEDISFDVFYRSDLSFDTLVQAAGRVNRITDNRYDY